MLFKTTFLSANAACLVGFACAWPLVLVDYWTMEDLRDSSEVGPRKKADETSLFATSGEHAMMDGNLQAPEQEKCNQKNSLRYPVMFPSEGAVGEEVMTDDQPTTPGCDKGLEISLQRHFSIFLAAFVSGGMLNLKALQCIPIF